MDGHVDLGANLESYVDRLVQEGGFASREDVIRESVRMMQEREEARAAQFAEFEASLRQGIDDIDAGLGRPAEAVFADLEARYAAMERSRRQA